ncbi:MAG: uncharacterized protein QOF29_403 [bacterium]|jgi:DUF917 family protein|nr:uncharacterized protein [Solirubrobacteraceae bacterium]
MLDAHLRPRHTSIARLDASNLPALARGCAVLGAGGGGDPALGLTMALHAVAEHGPVTVIDAAELPDEALVMPCGLLGSPTIAEERIWSGEEGRLLAAVAQRLRGEPVGALMAYEIGGVNGLLPVAWAARMGVALVDADGRGRAFPELPQQAMHLAGIAASPVVLADGHGTTLVVDEADDARAERLARSAAAALGGVCAVALCCMTAAQVRTAAILGSVSGAAALGEALGAARPGRRLDALLDALGAVVLLRGRVLDVERRTGDGFARGSATVDGTGGAAGRRLRVELQNEFLLALEDGQVRAAAPDLIALLGADGGEPIGTEELHRGQRVTVIAAPAPAVWGSAAGRALAGPEAFGYGVPYAPIGGAGGPG